jgi:hypothetical protein
MAMALCRALGKRNGNHRKASAHGYRIDCSADEGLTRRSPCLQKLRLLERVWGCHFGNQTLQSGVHRQTVNAYS